MTPTTPLRRRNLRHRRPRPMIHWLHLLGFGMVTMAGLLWLVEVHQTALRECAVVHHMDCR